MALRKLENGERLYLSHLITRLKDLNEISIAKDVEAYSYSWQSLARHIQDAEALYEHIIEQHNINKPYNKCTPKTENS